MSTRTRFAIACTALALPLAAAATASAEDFSPFYGTDRVSDVAYCQELARIIRHYNNWTLAGADSIDLCGNGKAAEDIPVLSKALQDKGFTVPPRP
jgi:hypothetical protein